jgi:GNAT superfamily N-acetyltransferase
MLGDLSGRNATFRFADYPIEQKANVDLDFHFTCRIFAKVTAMRAMLKRVIEHKSREQQQYKLRLRIIQTEPGDFDRYIELLEEVAEWLAMRQIRQWSPGIFRTNAEYYAESIKMQEVYLAFLEGALAGTLRLLPEDPIVWPEVEDGEALYVYNLAVRRIHAGKRLGTRMLDWAAVQTLSAGRAFLRLDCFAHNDFLCRYYLGEGFEDRSVVDAPYPEPIGTLQLRRFEKRLSGG